MFFRAIGFPAAVTRSRETVAVMSFGTMLTLTEPPVTVRGSPGFATVCLKPTESAWMVRPGSFAANVRSPTRGVFTLITIATPVVVLLGLTTSIGRQSMGQVLGSCRQPPPTPAHVGRRPA